jgi:hypothetical protein
MLTRREFLERSFVFAAGLPLARRHRRAIAHAAPVALRIAVPDAGTSTRGRARRSGLVLGVEEANHAAALFGGSVTLVSLAGVESLPHGVSALIGGDDDAGCEHDADRAAAAAVLFLNVGCSDDSLRGTRCRRTTFHVAPSDAMYRDALRLAHAGAGARGAAWDPSLARFGADTLNDRFRARFDAPMTADAWTAWLAVKILWESALRTRASDPATLGAYLARDTTQFDGHKGQALSFRAWDHQLRQPVYVMRDGRVLGQQPASATGDESTRDALDRIGTSAARSACRLS